MLATTLVAWLGRVTAVRAHRPPATWREVEAYLTTWRGCAVDWLARHPDGAQDVDELTTGLCNARAAIDRPADRQYAGPCTAMVPTLDDPEATDLLRECGTDLYPRADAAVVVCGECGAEYDAAERALAARASRGRPAARPGDRPGGRQARRADLARHREVVGAAQAARRPRARDHAGRAHRRDVPSRGRPRPRTGGGRAPSTIGPCC